MDNTKIGLHVKCIHSLASSGIKTMKHNSGRHRMCLGDCFSTTCSLGTEKHWRRALTPSTDRGRQGSEGQELTQNQKQQPPPPCREEDGRVFVCIAAAIKMNALSSRSSVSIAKSCFNGEGQNLLGNCTAKIRNFILSLSPSPSLDGENMMQWQKETINVNDQEESHEQVYTSSLRLRKDCPLTPISPTEVKRLAHKTAQETGKKTGPTASTGVLERKKEHIHCRAPVRQSPCWPSQGFPGTCSAIHVLIGLHQEHSL